MQIFFKSVKLIYSLKDVKDCIQSRRRQNELLLRFVFDKPQFYIRFGVKVNERKNKTYVWILRS